MSPPSVHIIDDKEKLCSILVKDFINIGWKAAYSLNAKDAIASVLANDPDVVLLDVRLGEENGLSLLPEFVRLRPGMPVIVITGYGTVEQAVEAIKQGAYDYVQKPLQFAKLRRMVENASAHWRLQRQNDRLRREIAKKEAALLTCSPVMEAQLDKLQRLAATDFPVFLTGESGTGKELFAEFVHKNSSRCERELFKINCAAFPETLLDNELFGHEKGSYTGAVSSFPGIFERAQGSTLFMDEIGDMSAEIQAKILRTLQNREIRRIGGGAVRQIDVRFIAATNKDIEALVRDGRFREDLFYRLNLALLRIPPLRERREDIPLLATAFLEEVCRDLDVLPKKFSPSVLEIFDTYSWPGNVRELKNTVHYVAALSSEARIEVKDLPPSLLTPMGNASTALDVRGEIERKVILETLKACLYNKKKTAERLMISRKTLYNKLARYGIEVQSTSP